MSIYECVQVYLWLLLCTAKEYQLNLNTFSYRMENSIKRTTEEKMNISFKLWAFEWENFLNITNSVRKIITQWLYYVKIILFSHRFVFHRFSFYLWLSFFTDERYAPPCLSYFLPTNKLWFLRSSEPHRTGCTFCFVMWKTLLLFKWLICRYNLNWDSVTLHRTTIEERIVIMVTKATWKPWHNRN